DLVSYERKAVPPNLAFGQENVLTGLSCAFFRFQELQAYAVRPLIFIVPDNTFDFVYQRLLFLAIPRDKWPAVIKELARVTKPGGYIQVVEAPVRGFYYNPAKAAEVKEAYLENGAFGTIYHHLREMIASRGADPLAGERLAGLCAEAGLVDIVEKKGSLPFGWNGPIGKLCLADVRGIFAGLKPFVLSKARMTDEEYEQLCIDAAKDSEENLIYMNAFSVTARVPEM
ncbi:hypothetical protein HK405_014187, partial [Cladochytrium tenue]